MADGRLLWKALGSFSGAVAGWTTRSLLRAGWKRARGGDPPANPASPSTAWSEALIWAAASGVAIAVTRLVAQRGAAEAWKATTGQYPAGMESVTP